MNNRFYYGVLTTMVLLTGSLNSWGSETLPQHFSRSFRQPVAQMDTVPVNPSGQASPQQGEPPAAAEAVQPVIKQVPKSRKKLKPAAVKPKVVVRPTKIIKPKVVIKKINIAVP